MAVLLKSSLKAKKKDKNFAFATDQEMQFYILDFHTTKEFYLLLKKFIFFGAHHVILTRKGRQLINRF